MKTVFSNNGTFAEQVKFQEEIQRIGLNLVSCGYCGCKFMHRIGGGNIICPTCKTEGDPSIFSDMYYRGMDILVNDLEAKVLRSLRNIVEKSNVKSKHFNGKCIKINVFNYTELALINDELTFLDDKGIQYSIWNGDCAIEDFIDILNSNI